MKTSDLLWPVPQSFSQELPAAGQAGSFWEDRGDRFHCGVDIYAPLGSVVRAVENGIVVRTELFTSPKQTDYWNKTFAITIEHENGYIIRYAELGKAIQPVDHCVRRGETLGFVGKVLEPDRITETAPHYIQKLKQTDHPTMLHLEMFDRFPFDIPQYLGGNTFQNLKPDGLLDPVEYFNQC